MAEDLSRLKIDKPAQALRPSRRRAFLLPALILLVAVCLAALYVLGVLKPAAAVQTATASFVYPSQNFTVLNASGYIVAQRKAAVASKATGRLTSLWVEEGSRVARGQVIAQLENDDAEASRDQAAANLSVSRANLNQAKTAWEDAARDYDRNRRLLEKGIIARNAFDLAETRYRSAQAAVAGAEAAIRAAEAGLQGASVALEYTRIRAPFDAVVLTKNADIGDIVTPLGAAANAKAAVVTIADLGSLVVEVDVSEANIGRVTVGQPCEIQLDAMPDERFPGRVHMIVPTVDRSKAAVMVKVRFLNTDLRRLPDMSAKVAFLSRPVGPDEGKPRLGVPRAAVMQRGGRPVVYVVRGDRVRETDIRTGRGLGEMIEVTGGLKAGEKVVVNPPAALGDGGRIEVAEP
ncbi:MAG TPA: efflux RND transporter periplasmic adaptor subunit [Syntrophus sp. (in: bacteria)]|nr:efflux RND transporter periplasmic adaptor subunit [Syntrophus sp. (in: bacteria)]